MDEIILRNENGQILASSREVADRFGKNHKDVLELEISLRKIPP